MEKMRISVIVFSILMLYLSGCEDDNCGQTAGEIVQETRDSNPFNYITIGDQVNLEIKQDTFWHIMVEGGENMIPYLTTSIKDGVLEIKDNNTCDWLRGYGNQLTVYATVVDLDSIRFSGGGIISTIDTLKTELFVINFHVASGSAHFTVDAKQTHWNIHTGAGDITLKGKCYNTYIYGNGNSWIWADSLYSSNVQVTNWSTGDIYLWASNTLGAHLNNAGSVYYKGDPLITGQTILGSGELKKIN